MTRLSEKRDVQDALVNHLIGIGWEYLPPNEIKDLRSLGDFGGLSPEREPFLVPIARQQPIALNPSTSLPSATLGTGRAGPGLVTPENVDDVLRRLRGVHPSIAGNMDEFPQVPLAVQHRSDELRESIKCGVAVPYEGGKYL